MIKIQLLMKNSNHRINIYNLNIYIYIYINFKLFFKIYILNNLFKFIF